MKLLLIGASGLVGGHVLAQALAAGDIEVVAPGRRPHRSAPRLQAPVVDFDALPGDAPWWHADAAICTLGTTMRAAGSREAFRRVDLDLVLAVARLARAHGTRVFALNSALGADARSRVFYNRTKGEAEDALRGVGFASLTLVRPGLIGGQRAESRPAERIATMALRALGPALPRAWRINPAANIAAALLRAAREARPGEHVVGSAALA